MRTEDVLLRVLFIIAAVAALCFGLASHWGPQETKPFTVAVIPDTQYYCSTGPAAPAEDTGTPEMYYDLTQWLHDQADSQDIRFAIHLGDLIQNPGEQGEWEIADVAQRTLEWSIPYSVLPGNHDIDEKTGDSTYYDQYFGPERFADQDFYGGHEGDKNHNNYCFFKAGGMDFMVLNIEHNPSDKTLAWAAEILKKHINHRVILATHSYLGNEERNAEGERIWNGLVKRSHNIFMVLSGHVPGWNHRISANNDGNPVIEILTDYQWEPDGRSSEQYAGDGWLNLMVFEPNEDKIHFKSYSPYLKKWWKDDPEHEYTLDYQMASKPTILPFLVAILFVVCAWKIRWPKPKKENLAL
ncbi:MAG: metallophosphoesterase [Planctomycetia bacterium]|jgi:hypothetical protein